MKIGGIFMLINCVCQTGLFQSYLAVILIKVQEVNDRKKKRKQHFRASSKYFLSRDVVRKLVRFATTVIYSVNL